MSTSDLPISQMPQCLIDLINEKKDDPANHDSLGRLRIAPGVYVRNWLTPEERLLVRHSEGTV